MAIVASNRPDIATADGDGQVLRILESWTQGIAIRQGQRFVFVNHAFAEMCGYESREAVQSLGSVYALVAEGASVIGDQHVALDDAVRAMHVDSVEHRRTKRVGDEQRNAALGL